MSRLRYFLIAIAVLLISILLPELPVISILLRTLDLSIYDTILEVHNAITYSEYKGVYDQICIVDIDEKSIKELGQFSSWPSLFFADLVNTLSADEPVAIAFDVFFTESDSIQGYARERLRPEIEGLTANPDIIMDALSTDDSFAAAIENAGMVYLSMFNSDYPSYTGVLPDILTAWKVQPKHFLQLKYPIPPIPQYANSARGIGFANIEPDVSGKIHDYPLFLQYNNNAYLNFSMQICLDLLGVDQIKLNRNCQLLSGEKIVSELPLSPDGLFYFKYYGQGGPDKTFRYISFSDVLFHRIPPGYFKDRLILVGTSAYGLKDSKITPLDNSFPGVELHSTFIRNVLEENYVRWVDSRILLIINILALLFMAIFIPRSKPFVSISVFLFISLLSIPAVYLLYVKESYIYNYNYTLVPWVLGFLAMFITQAHEQGKEKRMVRDAFEHYVSPEVIQEIMKEPEKLKAGGEKKYISIMYVDVRNFTSFCEQLTPSEITGFMNNYFNRATQTIIAHRGTLDKYIGDAILALFGAPVTYPGFEENAVKSALAIRQIVLNIKEEYKDHPVLKNFRIGIGIATGEVIVGNIGSDRIFNYTGIGDKMNFGSRLEGLNKYYLTTIIIDEYTYRAVSNTVFCRKLDKVKVKGKLNPCEIYEIIDTHENMQNQPELISAYHKYETALDLMLAGQKNQAKTLFEEVLAILPSDEPSRIMLNRCEIIDWDTWDGSWQFESK